MIQSKQTIFRDLMLDIDEDEVDGDLKVQEINAILYSLNISRLYLLIKQFQAESNHFRDSSFMFEESDLLYSLRTELNNLR